jgi:5-methyltetrahydrofolate--homocysteine methyltransferase
MTEYRFLQRLKQSVLVSDGATGTNLQKYGLPRGVASDVWVLDQPQRVLQLHREFIAAGSDILLTNTFGGSRIRLAKSNLENRAVELNRAAVALARQAAAGTEALVAGSMGPTGELLYPNGRLQEDEMRMAFTEQAHTLVDAGVDLLVVETQFDLAEAKIAIESIRSFSDLPVVCSFSFDRGTRTMMGVKPTQLSAELEPLGVNLLGINCGKNLPDNLLNLQALRQSTQLPIWFKPNAGLPHIDENGESIYAVSADDMGLHARSWIDNGAAIVGGCCGTSPEHLHQIALHVKEYSAHDRKN